jgi:hypothetical protein|tara:strand:+ start:2240 stop:2485 length:246 start_codon:yes stop_codon:yes gene_type:complete
MPRGSIFSEEQINIFVERTIQHQQDNPQATQAGLARYAGCDISVLKRLEKQGRIKLPKPLTRKQQRKRSIDWAKTLGKLTW